MLRGANLGHSLASKHPQLLDLMRLLPPHMVWTGLDTIIAVHYIKLLLTSGKPIVEEAPIPIEHLSS